MVYIKTGLSKAANMTVGGPTGTGLSGGEVIINYLYNYTGNKAHMMLLCITEKKTIHSNAVVTHAQHTFS